MKIPGQVSAQINTFGTRERLAKELLLATAHAGQMPSRSVRPIGRGRTRPLSQQERQRHDGAWGRWKPCARFRGTTAYLETQFGKPFTSTGFYNWFKRACVKAGIGHCSPGLRKATSRRLAGLARPFSKAAP
jgi:hypothetical protein